MSELEEKGYLFHPHTSAGRIPTDRAYRVYVDELMRLAPPSHEARHDAPGGARPARATRSRRSCAAPPRSSAC